MIIHDLKLTFRQLAKNKTYSFLGIAGFAFGFAVCLVIALFIHHELTVDTCFKKHERIFRVLDNKRNSVYMAYNDKDIYLENYPEIEKLCPIEYHAEWARPVQVGKKAVYINGSIATDSTFFDVFSIPVIKSISENPLAEPSYAVLTESGAADLFGNENPLGKQLIIDNDKLLIVSGVIPDFPENASIKADILLNTENEQIRASFTGDGKGGMNYAVNFYALLYESSSPRQLKQKMNNTLEKLGAVTPSIDLQRLDQIYLAQSINGNSNKSGNVVLLIMFAAIGLMILILSLINNINFIFSLQLKKLKEIGIKKTSGAGFKQLITSYIVEITVWVLFSLLFAFLIVEITLPYSNYLFGRQLHMAAIFSIPFSLYLGIFLLFVIFISGMTYTYLLSKFDFKSYINGYFRDTGKHSVKRVTTIFQFVISIILLFGVFGIREQIQYVKHKDLGFNKEHLLMLKFPYRYKQGQVLQNQLAQYPSILSSSLSMGNPGNIMYSTSDQAVTGNSFLISRIDVDNHFLETFDIKLQQGRSFWEGEYGRACIINETAFKNYGWKNFQGRKFKEFPVVGVVKDFQVGSLRGPQQAICLVFNNDKPSTLNLRLASQNIYATMEFIKTTWYKVSPQTPFEYQFYDDWYDSLYKDEERFASTINLFAIIAFLITCFGLLGQVIHICVNRTKEIGIRKVVGASVPGIVLLLTKQFVKWVIIANIIALPIAYYLMNEWLENFAYRIDISWWIFALSGGIAFLIASATVSFQAIKAATANPVESLRYE